MKFNLIAFPVVLLGLLTLLDIAPPPPADTDPLPPEQPVRQRAPDKETLMLRGDGGLLIFSVASDAPTLTVCDSEQCYTVDLVQLIRNLPRSMFRVKDATLAGETQ
jgi:hypothetical protein